MTKKSALIFGYNEYTLEIEKSISSYYDDIHIFKLNEEIKQDELSSYHISSFDLSDDWDDLKSCMDMNNCVAFCVLEDMAENIFLTISLRDTFKDLIIVALAEDKESTDKLMLAGASRVLPTTQTTANIIVEILEKPIVTEVLHHILYEQSSLKISQIKVGKSNFFDGKYPADIDWSRDHGIIVISIVHEDMSSEFIYSAKEKHHNIRCGDIFVVVGYEEDINSFEKLIGGKCD